MKIPMWMTNVFYAPDRFKEVLDPLLKVLRQPSVFAADNLITFGKSLHFLQEGPFRTAFDAARPNNLEVGLVWRNHVMCWAGQLALQVPGDFVEAGCDRGFSVQVLTNCLGFADLPRRYWLYDSFGGPERGEKLFERTKARFASLPNVTVISGSLPEALETGPERVAFLHLDMNNADAEIGTLERLWERMPAGAVVLVNDFGWAPYAEQTARHAEWFGARGEAILELPTGQGLIVKKAAG
jgi:O-methyltransferase